MSWRAPVALALLALAVSAAGCGGSDETDAAVERPPLTSAQTAPATTATTAATTTTPPATTPTTTTPATSTTTTTNDAGGAPDTPPSSSGGAPAGCPSVVGGFVREVRESGADCARARSVGEAWFAAVHGGAAPDSQVAAAGYRCQGTLDGERAEVTCNGADGGTVTFVASP